MTLVTTPEPAIVVSQALHVLVATQGGTLPAWVERALVALERDGTLALTIVDTGVHTPRAGLGVAIESWLVRKMLPPARDAWRAVPMPPRRCVNTEPALEIRWSETNGESHAPECWSVQLGWSGTRYQRELEKGETALGVEIRCERAGEAPIVVARTHTKAASSLALSRSRAAWKASSLLERSLRARVRGAGVAPSMAHALEDDAEITRVHRAPWIVRTLVRAADRILREDAWQLAWRAAQPRTELPKAATWTPEQWLVPPRGRFYADPFLLTHEGCDALFFEELDFATGRGHIACCRLDDDGEPSVPRVVLAADHHLSYPFVFTHDGRAYMIPETHGARRVELWCAVEFPWRWSLERLLLDDIEAVDTTWFARDGLYWLFACVASSSATRSEELCAFWSEEPFGPWTPHAANPIVDHPCGARPAGRPFVRDGVLVRPAQDVAEDYGKRILFQSIDALDPREYREHTIGRFEASWLAGAVGTHTYDANERYEVVDVRTRRWKTPVRLLGMLRRGSMA